jgi:hypothetical protein
MSRRDGYSSLSPQNSVHRRLAASRQSEQVPCVHQAMLRPGRFPGGACRRSVFGVLRSVERSDGDAYHQVGTQLGSVCRTHCITFDLGSSELLLRDCIQDRPDRKLLHQIDFRPAGGNPRRQMRQSNAESHGRDDSCRLACRVSLGCPIGHAVDISFENWTRVLLTV